MGLRDIVPVGEVPRRDFNRSLSHPNGVTRPALRRLRFTHLNRGADPQGALRSRVLSEWKWFLQAQPIVFGLAADR